MMSKLACTLIISLIISMLAISCGQSKQTTQSTSDLSSFRNQNVIKLFEATEPNAKFVGTSYSIDKSDRKSAMSEQKLRAMLNGIESSFSIPISEQELSLVSSETRAIRFYQSKAGVPIEGAEIVCILGQDEETLKALNSSIIDAKSLNETPSISENEAVEKAREYLKISADPIDSVTLMFVQTSDGYSLSWRVTFEEDTVDVSAELGTILKSRTSAINAIPAINIYNAELVPLMPSDKLKGILVLENGKKSSQAKLAETLGYKLVTDSVIAANENFKKIASYYDQTFKRSGYDGQGGKIAASVEVQKHGLLDIIGLKQNAAWMESEKLFIFGAGGDKLAGFAEAIDVVGHEYTHAVVSYSSKLVYEKQSGALNEHLADVFAELIQQSYEPNSPKFLIGETVLRGEFAQRAKALRDMQNPGKGLSAQPGHMSETPEEFGSDCKPARENDLCGVHTLSGIPNKAAVDIMVALGKQKSSKLFYDVMISRLRGNSSFADYRNQMLDECMTLNRESDCQVVQDAFANVGL